MKRGFYETTIDGIVIPYVKPKKPKKKCKTDMEIDEITAVVVADLKEKIVKMLDGKIEKLKSNYYE